MTTTNAALSIIRVSGDAQDETTQRGSCTTAAAREHLHLVDEIQLHAVSGFKGDKRHLAAMDEALARVRSGEVSAIVVAHSSRAARLPHRDVMRWQWDLEDAGGRIVSHDEEAWAKGKTPMDDAWSMMTAGENHKKSEDISMHVSRKFDVMRRDGFHAGWCVAGYEIRCTVCDAVGCAAHKGLKRMFKHPVAAEAVTTAFLDAHKGKSTPQIARTFKGVNERHGTRLPESAEGVGNLLRMTEYSTGRHRESVACKCTFDALISPAQQQAALVALDARQRPASVRAISKDDYSGALMCGACTTGRMYRKFAGKHADGSTTQRRYACKACKKTVQADHADYAVDHAMSGDRTPWYVPVTADPNADRDRQLKMVTDALSALPSIDLLDEDETDIHAEARALLKAERKRLRTIPDQPVTTFGVPKTDDLGKELTHGDRWDLWTAAERRDHLTAGSAYAYVQSAGDRSGKVVVTIELERDQD